MSLDTGPVSRTCLALALLLSAFAAETPAYAQSRRPPYDAAEIQRQIQKSVQLQRQALQSLTDPGQAERLVRNAWTELPAALNGMTINASEAKFVDPLFDINNKKAQSALSLLQIDQSAPAARPDQEGGAQTQASYLDGVRRNLEEAVRLTNGIAY
jgi:hypothetical protein